MNHSGSNRREKIFSEFKDHLNFLNDKGFIQTERNICICPLCLGEYKQIEVENPLTLEKHNGLIDLQLYPANLDSMDCLFDEGNIRAMVEWINKRNKQVK